MGKKAIKKKPSSTMYSHAAPKVGIDYKRAKSGLQDKLRKK
jgi:hypothetical protein